MARIVLASKSPRRQELLKDIVKDFLVEPSFADEIVDENTDVYDIPRVLSLNKALDVSKKYTNDIVIGSDTVVIVDSQVLNKPQSEAQAYEMLKMLSGRCHKVVTGCALVCNEKHTSFSVETEVEFFELTDEEIYDYISTGDCMDKAGAYGIQSFGKTLVKSINGDYFNVVGLPVARLKRELDEFIKSIDF